MYVLHTATASANNPFPVHILRVVLSIVEMDRGIDQREMCKYSYGGIKF